MWLAGTIFGILCDSNKKKRIDLHQNTTYEKKNLKGEQRIPAGIAYYDSAGPGCGSAVSVHVIQNVWQETGRL